jgi:hypothetical protein
MIKGLNFNIISREQKCPMRYPSLVLICHCSVFYTLVFSITPYLVTLPKEKLKTKIISDFLSWYYYFHFKLIIVISISCVICVDCPNNSIMPIGVDTEIHFLLCFFIQFWWCNVLQPSDLNCTAIIVLSDFTTVLILTVRSTINSQDWKLCENNVKKHNNKPAFGLTPIKH